MAKIFRVVFLLLACYVLQGCALGPAPADPAALTMPVYEPLVNGKLLTVEVIRVNGHTAPGKSLEKAIKGFSKYVAGEVRMLEGEPVELELGGDRALTKQQFESVVNGGTHRGVSAITFVIAPDFDFFHSRGAYERRWQINGPVRQSIKINGQVTDLSASKVPFVSRETFWQIVMLHELCHALGVPSDRSHTWEGRHCTNPSCVLYPRVDKRSVLAAILRLGPPLDLCKKCQEEIRKAQENANGNFYDPSQPYEPSEEIIRLNPDNSVALINRALEYTKRKDYQKTITDCSRAIEIDSDCLEGYSLRAIASYKLGEYTKAIADFRQAIRINPNHMSSLQILAWVLSTAPQAKFRDGKYAVELATRACKLTNWKNPSSLSCLAAAQAEVGNFQAAIQYQKKAVSLTTENNVKGYHKTLDLYQAGKPYRESKK